MTRLLFYVLTLGLIQEVSAQQNSSTQLFLNEISRESFDSEIRVNERGDTLLVSYYFDINPETNAEQRLERKYKSTPYFQNKWFHGSLVLPGGEEMEGILSFNVIKNLVHFTKDVEVPAQELRPSQFTLDKLVFYDFSKNYKVASKYYYNLIVPGEPGLVLQHHGELILQSKSRDDGYGNSKTNEYAGKFIKRNSYYLVYENEFILVSKKKTFFKELGPLEKKAKAIVKKYKLNLKKTQDIVTFTKKLQI